MVSERKKTPWYLRLLGYKKYRYYLDIGYGHTEWHYSDV